MAIPNNNTKRPDLNLLATLVHTNAVRHGWWENQLSDEHYLTLVISELAEAVEADRKDSKADKESFEITLADWQDEAEREADPEQWRYEFMQHLAATLRTRWQMNLQTQLFACLIWLAQGNARCTMWVLWWAA